MKVTEEDIQEDPAKENPWKRYFLRTFTTNFLIYLAIIIPGLVFYTVSIFGGLSFEIGILLAFISFILYIYYFWKKELWNKIKR